MVNLLDYITIGIACLFSFIVTYVFLPGWINRAKKAGLVGIDKNKVSGKKVAEVGGIPVISGFLISILFFIAIQVFVLEKDLANLVTILAVVVSILIALILGFVDDILGWKIGLRIRYKIILSFLISLPIVVINSGVSQMSIPFFGLIDFGLVYPLVLIPIAIIGTSNAFNMIAGFNGLEAGMGIITLFFLGVISLILGNVHVAILAFVMIASLVAFFIFNSNPASIFPGDSLTYAVGALIGIVAIVGNIEKYAIFLFTLYFFEFILKARGGMKKESFAKVNGDGSLSMPYRRFYGVEHVAIKVLSKLTKRVTENKVVYSILLVQLAVGVLTLVNFYFINF